MAGASLKLHTMLHLSYTAFVIFNLLCVVGIITAIKDAPADQSGYWKFVICLAAVLGCFVADAYLVYITIMAPGSLKLHAILLVPYTAFLIFNLLCFVGIIKVGKDVPADQSGYWKFVHSSAVLGCFVVDAYLVSVIVSSRRVRKFIEGQLSPPPPQMDMC